MNSQNIILDKKTFLNSYKNKPSKVKYQFPIRSNTKKSEEYAYLIGKIIGDGNLDSKFTCRFVGQREDLKLLKYLITNQFNLKNKQFSIRNKKARGKSAVLQLNNSSFGRIIYLLGAPIGNKTKIPFQIPAWIVENSTNMKRFLQALLEDELTTIKIEKCNYSIKPRLKMAKRPILIEEHKRFMKQVKESIESFGVECSHISKPIKTKTKCLDLYFHINRKKNNILRFQKNIAFRLNQNKIKNLNECCNTIKKSLEK